MLVTSLSDDDPRACTRYTVTVTPTIIAPRRVARSVGDIVAGCVGAHRHDDVVLAVHEVLVDTSRRHPRAPLTVRVRENGDHVDVEVLDRETSAVTVDTGSLRLARALSDGLVDEITDVGHVVRLTFRCATTGRREPEARPTRSL